MTAQSPDEKTWRWQKWHWALLAAGLVLRLAWALSVGREDSFGGWDGREYHAYSQALGAFQGDEYSRFFNFVRAPGYPVFLIPFVKFSANHVWHIQVFQSFLSLLQVLALTAIALRWAGRRAANGTFILALFHPFLIYYCGFVLTETLFITLFWLGLAALQRLLDTEKPDPGRWLAWSGVAFGLACLVRPATQPFLVVAVLWLGWQARRLGWFTTLARMGAFTAIVSALLLPSRTTGARPLPPGSAR